MGSFIQSYDHGEEANCATLEATYSIDFATKGVLVKVNLPQPGMTARLSKYQQALIRRRIHDAILPALEMIYANVWDEMFAGKGEPPYPAKHTDMHTSHK